MRSGSVPRNRSGEVRRGPGSRPRLCWAPTSFQLTTELYPQELRQHGLALSHAGLPGHSSRWKENVTKNVWFFPGRHLSTSRCSTTASRLEHAGTHTFCGPSKATKTMERLIAAVDPDQISTTLGDDGLTVVRCQLKTMYAIFSLCSQVKRHHRTHAFGICEHI